MPEDLRRLLPAWPGHHALLTAVDLMSTDEEVITLCKAARIAVTTWVAIVRNDVLADDSRTGLLQLSRREAARRVGRSINQIERARHIGLYTERKREELQRDYTRVLDWRTSSP